MRDGFVASSGADESKRPTDEVKYHGNNPAEVNAISSKQRNISGGTKSDTLRRQYRKAVRVKDTDGGAGHSYVARTVLTM